MNKKTLSLYWGHVRRHKRTFFLMLFAIPIGATIIDVLLPYSLSQAIAYISTDSDALTRTLWIAAGVGVLGAALNYIGFQAIVRHESSMLEELREDTFEKLIRKDFGFFTSQKIGAMTSRYIDFVRSYVTLQDLLVIRTLGFILSVGTGLVILATHSLIVAGIVAALIILLIVEIRWSTKLRAPWRHERKTLVSEIHGEVADALTNSLIVKSYANEDREIKHVQKMTARFTKIYRKDIGFTVAEGSTRVFIMVLVQIIVIVVASKLVLSGQMSLAVAVFVLAYMQRIGSQLFILSDIINGYDHALLEAQPMAEMLLTEDVVVDAQTAKRLSVTSPSIELRDVTFNYGEGGEAALSKLDITIEAGQKVGLVGHSGAGKSTLMALLLRFSDVTDGAILIDGNDIRSVTQKSLRKNIAYVPQEPMLFHRTLRENIAYGKPDATDSEIRQAAKDANALEFIEQLPNGFDTTVGERGVKLSGGQRQRVAIARAILKDAPILILDEATSALDSESEKLIQKSLERLMKNRTSIVIAHRLSTIAKLDRIIVLENGKVIEDGSHAMLIEQDGVYARLWMHQSNGFIEE